MTLAGNASGVIGLAQIQSNTESSGIGFPGVSIRSSLNPSFTDQSVTLTITVSGNVGTPTGSVNVQDNFTVIPGCADLPLVNGTATCTTTFTTGGRHDIFATYPGDANYYSGSGSIYQDVIQRLNTASVSLAASPNPAGFGENVDIVASVTGGAGTPTGTVRFRDGTGDIYGCTAVPLSGGSATCRTDGLASGTRSLSAVYSGDANYNEATSATINESVGPAPAPTRAWRTLTTSTPPLALENPNFRIPGRPRTAMDAAGDLYVAANTWTSSTSCMAILKYSGSTGGVLWRRDSCGADQGTFASSLALDGSGNVLVTGAMASDLYVAKLSGATGAPMWEQRFAHAPNSSSAGMSIGVDAAGNARLAALDSAGLTL
jgi:hypothetical protein